MFKVISDPFKDLGENQGDFFTFYIDFINEMVRIIGINKMKLTANEESMLVPFVTNM